MFVCKQKLTSHYELTCAMCTAQALKHALIINDLSYVQVIAADGSWAISNDILNNLRFAAAVDIIG